ncbi:MAG TPA: 2,3-bisphosphoglycerate-independent phosphoglycerate mutase [Candidatus Faecimonas gallistercoris]|nr:2,3-bisphosphoglycerate-independent phosphoglycerate mutase [Candidatus Faecimonas gallistercoris]
MKKPIVLMILDGYGLREETHGNAVKLADNKVFTELWNTYPHTKLTASGQLVGLPKGQMGNSEVGHMNIGAGRIVYQPLELINKSIQDKEFFQNKEIKKVMHHVKENDSKLHLMGLVSDGGVHSHINHLLALLDMCQLEGVKDVYLHLFTDGRDVPPKSAYIYIEMVENKLKELGFGKIASISGRYYAMDRDNNFDRLIKAYDVIVNNKGQIEPSPKEYIEKSYKEEITDEFFLPAKFTEHGNVEENDGIIAFNFRKDRLRELFTAITNPDAVDMETKKFNNVKTLTMMPVVESVKAPHAFNDPELTNILGEYIEKQDLSQLRIAETEKYAHVTFFFDGGKEVDYKNEKKILIPSPKVATYDLKPEMSADEVTEKLLAELPHTDLVILNFANGDMVGHTGVLEAAIKAVETVDKDIKRIYDKVMELGGTLIVTADHGNCEEMLDDNNNIVTSHTTNPVPFIITEKGLKLHEGKLGDIAPTILDLMNIEKPNEMTGESLIEK